MMAESDRKRLSSCLENIVVLLGAASILWLIITLSWFWGSFGSDAQSRGKAASMVKELGLLGGLILLVPSLTVLIINWRKLRWSLRLLLLLPVVIVTLAATLYVF